MLNGLKVIDSLTDLPFASSRLINFLGLLSAPEASKGYPPIAILPAHAMHQNSPFCPG